jgi:hypothetical protein
MRQRIDWKVWFLLLLLPYVLVLFRPDTDRPPPRVIHGPGGPPLKQGVRP